MNSTEASHPRRRLPGKYVAIALVMVILVITATFRVIKHQGRGAKEENRLVLTFMAGLRALDDQQYEVAVENLTEVIESKSRPEALGFRGEAYLQLKKYQEAERDFRAAIAATPNDPLNHGGLAEAVAGQGRYEEALAELDRAIALTPASAPPRDAEEIARTGDSLEELEARRAEFAAQLTSKP